MPPKKQKGTTMSLNQFIGEGSKFVTVRTTNWSEIVDHEEETKPIVVDIGALPTAPRAAHDIDESAVPANGPFVAFVANLSFEIEDESLRRIFADLNPKSARILRDGTRSRGTGFVEFETRENLIEALRRTDKEIFGRKIRVSVSDKTDPQQLENRNSFGNNRSHRGGGEERPEMSQRWGRVEPRTDESHVDRPSSGFNNRDRHNRNDHGRSNLSGGHTRDNQHNNDYGYGYPRSRDEPRGGHNYNRQGQQRHRYADDDNRASSGTDRPRYAGRYSDTRDTRDRNRGNEDHHDDHQDSQRERPRLHLQPRTKPLDEFQPLSGSSSSVNNVAANAEPSSPSHLDDESTTHQQTNDSSNVENQDSRDSNEQSTIKPSRGAGASIFGGAKPVDTAARELEIENKMKQIQLAANEAAGDKEEERGPSSRPSYHRGNERDNHRGKRSSHHDDRFNRDRRDEGRSGHGGDHYYKRENSDNQHHDDDGRKRNDETYHRRGGQSRRDFESGGRSGKYNQHERDNERGNYRNRDVNEFNNQGRSSNNNSNVETQVRNQPRGNQRRTMQNEDDTHKLQLSNKFGMLDDFDPDENDDAQSPSVDDD